MADPGLGLVIEAGPVVDRAEVAVGIVSHNDPKETVPVGVGLLGHEVELVGQRPPDVPVGRQPCKHITQVAVIDLGGHAIKAPVVLVIRMEEDQVGLDPEVARPADPRPRDAGRRLG